MLNLQGDNKNLLKLIIRILLVVCVMIGCFILGNISTKFGLIIGNEKERYIISEAREYSEFDTLFEARKKIDQLYDGEIDSNELVTGAIKGMVQSLDDPYSAYMTNDEYKKYLRSTSGEFIGIGVNISQTDKGILVVGLISGGGAEEAGIEPGDIIKVVDGQIIEKDMDKAVSLLTGEEEKKLKVTVTRDGKDINYDVQRRKVITESVDSEMLEGNIGYLRLKNFESHSAEQFNTNVNNLRDKGMKGLILDLRENGGGYVAQAVDIASRFIPKDKVITYTLDKYNYKKEYKSKGEDLIDVPVIILIDEGTASASEILTGALKDYDLVTTVGVTSFGKGIVQLPFVLPSKNGALKLTVSKYYSPSGENIHKKGIEPDYKVEIPDSVLKQQYSKEIDTQYQKALELMKEKIGA